ncbi:MAG: hypothetical protein ACJARX_001086 [Psychroserpens sp.]|jgi:hypothetical protein
MNCINIIYTKTHQYNTSRLHIIEQKRHQITVVFQLLLSV